MAKASESRKGPGLFRIIRFAVLIAALLCVIFGYQIITLYTDWQWFREMGQTGVFSTAMAAKLQLFFGFGLLFFLITFLNIWLAQRMNNAQPRTRRVISMDEREQFAQMVRKGTYWAVLAGAVVVSFMVGGNAINHWSEYLLYTHAGQFGQTDPIFHNDIGYYVFKLPFMGFLQGWFLFTLIAAMVATIATHAGNRAMDFVSGSFPSVEPFVRRHLLLLAGLIAIVFSWGLLLDRYDLLTSDNGAFFGAGYTDLHARLPVANIAAVLMLGVAVLCFVNIKRGAPFRLPLVGLGAWVVFYFLGNGVYPGFLQKFTVVPNQFGMEKEYIAHDIRFTQQAYGLDKVKVKDLPGSESLTAKDVADNKATIDNIRLWDWPQLGAVYTNRQAVRPYYRFKLPDNSPTSTGEYNIDVDRYHFGNEYRQVMLGARELYYDALPAEAQTWQNKRLQYTHGYGAVMSPVNRFDAQGLPEYFLSQIPVQASRPEVAITRPQIYYGEQARDYVFVDTKQSEFDYPAGDGNKETHYTGKGGLPLGGELNRLAWSIRLGDTNLLLSSDLAGQSRLLFRRNIRERVQTVAPFLNMDNDPYMVVDGGRMVWIIDCYTVSNRYPYSKPTTWGTGMEGIEQTYNYIRNSVKAVVDAYDGSVDLYVSDTTDPVINTWGRIFPGLLKPIAQLPPGLKAHIRYPEDLFKAQRDIYTIYHLSDARTYYGKEDAWEVPTDPTPPTDAQGTPLPNSQQLKMMPYYVMMKLPDGAGEEFLMMSPFSPRSKENMAAWMCAKCDPDDYGQLLVYRFPKGSNINGPRQIMSLVKKQSDVSRFQTLLGQQGSKVLFGNLLVIPVNSGLLYALPVYVQATDPTGNVLPGISQVIVATGDKVVMRPNLNEAIASLTSDSGTAVANNGEDQTGDTSTGGASGGAANGTTPQPAGSNAKPGTIQDVVKRASTAYQKARVKQKEYNSSLDELGRALTDLQNSLNTKK